MRQNSAKIDYDDLPGTARALRIPDKLILDDCFNLDLVKHFVENESGIKELTGVAPFKIKFPYIIFCKSGEGVFKVNMVEVPLKASQIMICPEGTIIDDIKLNMDTKIGFIAFSTEVFVSGISSECIAVLRRNIISPKVLDVDDKRLSLVLTTYGSMRSIMSMDHFSFKEDALKGCTTILLSMLSQWLYSQEKSSSIAKSRDETLFLNFLGEIRVNCSKERKVSYYAEKFHISPKYFATLIYNASGRHAAQWIKDQVIREAKSMLSTGAYTVQQVSDALGFPNASFFGKYFKGATGKSPKKFIVENA